MGNSSSTSSTHEYSTLIRESHLDTFGHVNNAVYLQLFEEARWEFITANGFGLKEVHQLQIGPVVLGLEMKFAKELKLREKITIRSTFAPIKGKIFHAEQTILNQKNEEACIAKFTFGLFDMRQRKLIDPTPEFLAGLGLGFRP